MIQQLHILDIIPGHTAPVIHCNQNDNGDDRLVFDLRHNGEPLAYGGSCKIEGTKPSGATFSVDGLISGTYAGGDLTSDMTNEAGDVICHLLLTDTNERIGTQNFILRVQRESK